MKVGGISAINPRWEEVTRVHDWRNYVTPVLRGMWSEFSFHQQHAIASAFNVIAESEEWE